jgi:hypothetical protein
LVACLSTGGCTLGPHALDKTFGPYYESIRRADEEELLRSLVHIRYNEAPGALSVSSIASQYELSGKAEAQPFFIAPNPSNSNVIFRTFTAILPNLSASMSNRPTISLSPGDDGETIRRFLTPISGDTLVFLVQTGWPPSTMLRLWADRLNGLSNGEPGNCLASTDPGATRFQHALTLFQSIADRDVASVRTVDKDVEVSGPLPAGTVSAEAAAAAAREHLELRPRSDGKTWALVRKEHRLVIEMTPGAENDPEMSELAKLLNLTPGAPRYDLVVLPGKVPDPLLHPSPASNELRITPRSTAQVYRFLASGVQTPSEHVTAGLVSHTCDEARGMFRVCSAAGHRPPRNAYIAVKYRGWWYYIDDADIQSKSTFSLMLELNKLDLRRRPPGGGPLLTLPAGT